ncbi:AraC family transcriptional regulator [Gluconobacter kanchanaburiensis]|uniref:Transcriptional regulator n=1 Tax=Gluconobacter kanchanaburiensis NBRC 103587 TaxID=1307948 RepID=A0A511B8G4_9PROT|nr:AraC family transcriptional regulator [Gluconobacter kanchanaburiensis]MBF0862583.1 AraC family transcriptional regulator [Gluconobacter kanchanaburiensis]GBR71614.1 AraC-type DNA-binding domain-containing protein [Gluconobacter kanchanaburiensis NBRC 103587]GEK96709.1 transcriptional regulator [Gluconobacter kanchanaburiensis NBRC 103587]
MNYQSDTSSLLALAAELAPRSGYNATSFPSVRILRSETILEDVPVLYRPGAVFVLQGFKQGFLNGEIYRYDAEHYLAVSVPVPFRMASQASPAQPLLAIYFDFDLHLAAEIATTLNGQAGHDERMQARSLISSRMAPAMTDVLQRLLHALHHPQELTILGPGLLRELHYRVLVGPQGGSLMAALHRNDTTDRIVQSLALIRERYKEGLSVSELAVTAGMSVPSYHVAFKSLTGNTPIQYLKALRLHEARLMIARRQGTLAVIAAEVGYASPAQFSRDFKRHFHRTPSEEAKWMREHLGEPIQA